MQLPIVSRRALREERARSTDYLHRLVMAERTIEEQGKRIVALEKVVRLLVAEIKELKEQ